MSTRVCIPTTTMLPLKFLLATCRPFILNIIIHMIPFAAAYNL